MKMLTYYVVHAEEFQGDYEYAAGPFNGRGDAENWISNNTHGINIYDLMKEFKIVCIKIEVE
jgi:hypothetical protein